jgi:hypothetical protein
VIQAIAMRVISSILLSLLLLQSAGPMLLLQLQQSQIRREMKWAIRAGLPDERLVRFEFETDDRLVDGGRVEWIEPHEFRYNGVMYDIARSVEEDGRTVHYCVRDDAETALYAQLDRLMREETNQDPERRRQAARILQHLLLPVLPPQASSFAVFRTGFTLPFAAVPATRRGDSSPPTPPPEA